MGWDHFSFSVIAYGFPIVFSPIGVPEGLGRLLFGMPRGSLWMDFETAFGGGGRSPGRCLLAEPGTHLFKVNS